MANGQNVKGEKAYLAYLAYRCSVASLRASDVPCELWSPEWAGGNESEGSGGQRRATVAMQSSAAPCWDGMHAAGSTEHGHGTDERGDDPGKDTVRPRREAWCCLWDGERGGG